MSKKGRQKQISDSGTQDVSGYAALGEEQQEAADEAQPNNLPTGRVELPLEGISYQEMKFQMEVIVRYVEEHAWWGNLADTALSQDYEEIHSAYRDKCLSLKSTTSQYNASIISVLDRWSVRPEMLRVSRLVTQNIDDQLAMLYTILRDQHMAWNPPNETEPAEFWLPTEMPAKRQKKAAQSTKSKSKVAKKVSKDSDSDDETYHNEAAAEEVFQELVSRSADVGPGAAIGSLARRSGRFRYSATDHVDSASAADEDNDEDDEQIASKQHATRVQSEQSSMRPKPKPSKKQLSRVVDGLEKHGEIRELDLHRLLRKMEVPLGRFCHSIILPFEGSESSIPKPTIRFLQTLAQQAVDEARFATMLVQKPLSKISIFKLGLTNIAGDIAFIVIPTTEQAIKGAVHKRLVPFWRVPARMLESKYELGFLSNAAQREWKSIIDPYMRNCQYIVQVCKDILKQPAAEPVDIETVHDLIPAFHLSRHDLFEIDSDDESPQTSYDPSQVTSSTEARTNRMAYHPSYDSYGSPLTTSELQLTPDKRGTDPRWEPANESRRRGAGPSDASADTSARGSTGSYSHSVATRSHEVVTIDEMTELWLRDFSRYSLVSPNTSRRVGDMKRESHDIAKLTPLASLQWGPVLEFVEQLRQLQAVHRDAAVPFAQCIDRSLHTTITLRYGVIYPDKSSGGQVTLADISAQELVKVLGRLCEASTWAAFKTQTLAVFTASVYTVNSQSPRDTQWQQLQRILDHLNIIVPLFGRQLGQQGAYVNSRDSNFVRFLLETLPAHLIVPLIDRLYSPNADREQVNVAYSLPPQYSLWAWSHVMNILLLLKREVAIESDTDRTAQERNLTYSTPMSSSPKAKMHSYQEDDVESEDDASTPYATQEAVHALDATRPQKTHAYGKSGTGDASPKLMANIKFAEKAWSHQSQAKPSVRFTDDKLTTGVCREFSEKGTCKFGSTCKYKHLEAERPEDQGPLIQQLRSMLEFAQRDARRSVSPRFNALSEDQVSTEHRDLDAGDKED